MKKYFAYYETHLGASALGDWTGATNMETPIAFIEQVYMLMFTAIFNQLGEDYAEKETQARLNLASYLVKNRCTIDTQTAISALIVFGVGEKDTLGQQLVERVEKDGNHLHCGMFGVQFLYKALTEIGRADLAYEMIMNKTAPSFYDWLSRGATTLWETFDESARTKSKNHHMFSNVLYFLTEGICGIRWCAENTFEIQPNCISTLDFAKCNRVTKAGGIAVEWQRTERGVVLKIRTSGDVTAFYRSEKIFNEEKIFLI